MVGLAHVVKVCSILLIIYLPMKSCQFSDLKECHVGGVESLWLVLVGMSLFTYLR
jgi:hypothetical protein